MANTNLSLELPEDVFAVLRVPREQFALELRLAAAIKWYEIGRISQEKAAELAGLSRAAFIDQLGKYQVSPFQESPEELRDEFNRG